MRLQVAAKVVGRLRGEEFPHFGAAYRARSAWVRRHYTPAASVLAGAMLHDADSPFHPAGWISFTIALRGSRILRALIAPRGRVDLRD